MAKSNSRSALMLTPPLQIPFCRLGDRREYAHVLIGASGAPWGDLLSASARLLDIVERNLARGITGGVLVQP